MSEGFLELSDISKRFGASLALNNVSLKVSQNECVLVLGSNGAGKSTLLRIISRLSRPDTGRVLGPDTIISWCGAFLYGALTVRENLALISSLSNTESRTQEVIKKMGLDAALEKLVSDLSKGYLQRTSLARAFLGSSPFILLDEPTSFLDDEGVKSLSSLLIGSQKTAIIATHDVARLKSLASRIVVLSGGRISLDTGHAVSSQERDEATQIFLSKLQ